MRKSCVLRITVVEKCLRLPAGNRKTTVVGFMAQREDNGFQKREQAGARSPILPVLIFRWIIAVFVLPSIPPEGQFDSGTTRVVRITTT